MNYVVAVARDRIQAETVYSALESAGLPLDKVAILGKGYKSADEYGLIDPKEQAIKQARFMAYWLIPFGFISGIGFSLVTGLNTFAWAGEFGNHLIGGLLGGIAGGLGSLFVGGGVGLVVGGGDALPYRNRLNAGKYLVAVKGSESFTLQATTIMYKFDLENIQGYEEYENS